MLSTENLINYLKDISSDPNKLNSENTKKISNELLNAANQLENFNKQNKELRAYQIELTRELQSCQNILYSLAYHGEVTPAYANDAKKVLDRKPQESLHLLSEKERSKIKKTAYADGAFQTCEKLNVCMPEDAPEMVVKYVKGNYS